jgi:citrate lyase subunit beta/citryl-CoA lyase
MTGMQNAYPPALPWRSLLFVAADDHRRLAKIATRGADAVILDLEDAVPEARKASARAGLADAIHALSAQGVSVVVRVNASWRAVYADLEAALRPGVAALMLPKAESPARLAALASMSREFAADTGLADAPQLIALIESAKGIGALDALAAVDGLGALALGSEDYALSLGVAPTPDLLDLPCRQLALAAARHGLRSFGLPVSIATIDDETAWCAAVRHARAIGISGALCVHPRQLATANAGFAPSPAEIAAATRIVVAWEAAPGAGALQLDGRMIDRPVVDAARHTLLCADPSLR